MSDILTQQTAGVLVVTFNRPARKNAFTTPMYQVFADTLRRAAQDNAIHAVLLQAPVWQCLHALNDFPKPLVAAVTGVAVGIGTTMLLHCDLVYAASDARFSLPFVNLGVCPEGASTLLLPRLPGYQVAARTLLLGEAFDAEFAQRAGLVCRRRP